MQASIKGVRYNNLPFKTKKELVRFINTDFKICPICQKIDVTLKHVNNCTIADAIYRKENLDNIEK